MHRPYLPSAPWRAAVIITIFASAALCALTTHAEVAGVERPEHRPIPILTYHRFALVPGDSMTVRIDNFESHLRAIHHAGFEVVPLEDVLAWYRGDENTLPERAIVITIDDGHRSVYEVLRPLLRAHHPPIPVTLFIYPSAISNAPYALTWDELRAMKRDGLFTIESHSYWHPNFRSERAQRDAESFRAFALEQFVHARNRIAAETGATATSIAWPFGIHDAELEALAVDAGYVAGFTIEPRPVTRAEAVMALPRYLITDSCGEECIWKILRNAKASHD